jgi:hypothetical protein
MSDESLVFEIQYHGKGLLIQAESYSGTLANAEGKALLGLIKHLYAGVEEARILDADGGLLSRIDVPTRRPEPDILAAE